MDFPVENEGKPLCGEEAFWVAGTYHKCENSLGPSDSCGPALWVERLQQDQGWEMKGCISKIVIINSAIMEPSCVPGTALSIEDNTMDRSGSCLPGVVSLASCM